MRNKINLILILMLAIVSELKSQTIDEALNAIESNNQEILAAQKLLESKTFEYMNMVLPDGPEFSYGYFADNASNPGPKETFEISQSFQMPCFYRNQSALSRLLNEQERLNYLMHRQSVLGEAKNLMIEFNYLLKMNVILQSRVDDAERLVEAFLKRLETGDVNVLEVNKSKLYLLGLQNQNKINQTELQSVQKQLVNMNGGKELNIIALDYQAIEIDDIDKIVNEKQSSDPEFLLAAKQSESSSKMVKVTKNLQLPKFSLGYAGETVANEKFRGLVVGMTIPLWSSRSAIKKARFESEFINLNSQYVQSKLITDLQVQIEKVINLKENLETYTTVLNSVNNIELLKKSLELGEISSIEYFTEINYYYQIYDDFLTLEKDYNLAISTLFKFRL